MSNLIELNQILHINSSCKIRNHECYCEVEKEHNNNNNNITKAHAMKEEKKFFKMYASLKGTHKMYIKMNLKRYDYQHQEDEMRKENKNGHLCGIEH